MKNKIGRPKIELTNEFREVWKKWKMEIIIRPQQKQLEILEQVKLPLQI